MKKLLFALFIFAALSSCERNKIYEDIITKHEDGSRKEVRYYKIDKDGNKTCIRETWYYMEGMKLSGGIFVALIFAVAAVAADFVLGKKFADVEETAEESEEA